MQSTPERDTVTMRRFYDLSLEERLQQVGAESGLAAEELAALGGSAGLSPAQADHMIENVVGIYSLPLGIARNFVVNGREVLVPMVLEEPSVVAGASFMAKLAKAGGGFTASADEPHMIGQMQIVELPDPAAARLRLLAEKDALLAEVARVDPVLARLGGGPVDLEVRLIEESPVGPLPGSSPHL